MFRTAVSGVQRTGLSVVPLGCGPLAQVSVSLAEQPQPGLGHWLVREPGRQHRNGRVQRLTEGDVLSQPARLSERPASDEHLVLDEPEHRRRLRLRGLGPRLRLLRLGPLPLGPHQPDRGADHPCGQHGSQRPAGQH